MTSRSTAWPLAATILFIAGVVRAQIAQVGYAPGDPGGSPEVDEYRLDDGVAENALGLETGGHFGWLTRYQTTVGGLVVTGIRVAFGTPESINGLPVTAYLWVDPDDDGNPSNALVVGSRSGVVAGASPGTPINNPTFVNFEISPYPLHPGQTFFIGVIMTHAAGQFPAAIDQTPPLPGSRRTWAVIGGSDPIDPHHLGQSSVQDMSNIAGLHGKWLIRADAILPEPSAFGLATIAMCAGALRRSRRRS